MGNIETIVVLEKNRYEYIEVVKYNHNHDPATGRFTTGSGVGMGVSGSLGNGKTMTADDGRTVFRYGYTGGSLSKTLGDVEKTNRNLSYEVATIVDRDGEVIFQKTGDSNNVSFNRSELMEIRGTILTHNHPESVIFSPADAKMTDVVREIRATTPDGKVYSISNVWGGSGFGKDYEKHYLETRTKALKDLGVVETDGPSDSSLPTEIRQKSFAVISEECSKWLAENTSRYGGTYKEETIMEKSSAPASKQGKPDKREEDSVFLDGDIGSPEYEANMKKLDALLKEITEED